MPAGQGVPQNLTEALRWLRKAHAQGHEPAAECDRTCAAVATIQQQGAAAAASPPKPSSASSSSSPFSSPIPIGTRVELHGLKMKKLNRQRGVVAGFDADSGRCVVKLEDGREFKSKAENLKRIATTTSNSKKKKKGGGQVKREIVRERERTWESGG